jgi:hypothetical protein
MSTSVVRRLLGLQDDSGKFPCVVCDYELFGIEPSGVWPRATMRREPRRLQRCRLPHRLPSEKTQIMMSPTSPRLRHTLCRLP